MVDSEYMFRGKGLSIKVHENNIERAIGMLRKKINADGIFQEIRKRRFFEPNTAKRRRLKAESDIRNRRRMRQLDPFG